MTIGIIGGTFDPIHIGHLIAAEHAWTKLGLDSVLFMPAGQPWFKANNGITVATHRLAMLQLAIASNPHFKLCKVEIEQKLHRFSLPTIFLSAETGQGVIQFTTNIIGIAEKETKQHTEEPDPGVKIFHPKPRG